ncbi:MAG: hypothetical protein ACOY93_02935 [Bacillota bacterium]
MRLAFSVLIGLWLGVYTASLAVGLWRLKNRRGSAVAAILALCVLVVPFLVEWILHNRT